MKQRKVILSMQMTLDGYIAGTNDEADWIKTGDDEWADLFKDLEQADTYLLGRKMYPIYSSYWQAVLKDSTKKGYDLEFAKLADKTQHIVFTKGEFKPNWNNTRVAHDVKDEIANLKKLDGKNIIVWGGANFAASLLTLGVLDEIRMEVNPVILGCGKNLFDDASSRLQLELIDSRPFESGLVLLRYKVNK